MQKSLLEKAVLEANGDKKGEVETEIEISTEILIMLALLMLSITLG